MTNQLIPILAQAGDWHAKTFSEAMLYCVAFGALGILLVFIGFKIFDKAITKVDLEAEVSKGNVAAAILSGAVIIALAIIIAASMS